MAAQVKICGLNDEEAIDAALEAGAEFIGFVFYPKSPRAVSAEQAAELSQFVEGVCKVGLFVDPDDALLDEVTSHLRLDMLQFHGSETPERLARVRAEYGVEVMKVIPVATKDDLAAAEPFYDVVDWILFDAKPPKGAALPGGNAVSFDWSVLAGFKCPVPWMLAGGLTSANVAEAIRVTGAPAVDVSSGVEERPGVKDPAKIAAFVAAAKGAA